MTEQEARRTVGRRPRAKRAKTEDAGVALKVVEADRETSDSGEGGAKKDAPKRRASSSRSRRTSGEAAAKRTETAEASDVSNESEVETSSTKKTVHRGGSRRRSKVEVTSSGLPCVKKSMTWAGRTLTLETGRLARQATGAVLASYGETMVLCTVVANPKADPSASYTPFLSVHYQTKTYAAGKIPGGYFKRESKPSEKDVLTSRLIDRPIRPLFPSEFYNEIQVICTVLSYDGENDPDIVAMVGTSAALAVSGIPFAGPIAGARVGYKKDTYILNPKASQMEETSMDLVVAGTKDGVLMVESEIAELSDKVVLGGVKFAHDEMQPVIKLIGELQAEAGKPAWEAPDMKALNAATDKIFKKFEGAIATAFKADDKAARLTALSAVKDDVDAAFGEAAGFPLGEGVSLSRAYGGAKERVLRDIVLSKKRIDGRVPDQIRPITCETSVLPRAHGSALFTRGETQALVVTTLGSADDAQIMDELGGEYRESFMLHYNFPSFSVGEAGRVGPPGRREIGHGKLAWRAIRPVLPGAARCPYTLRVVSEITESNGSSSMATVCGTSLALMDAGVALGRPVAGIAMGLVQEGKKHVVLSDISAEEDSLGDMDFKVACSEKGLTALQMDIKVTSITPAIMEEALSQAKDGCTHILGEMARTLKGVRKEMNPWAPRVAEVKVAKDKIRDIIGPGGSVIRALCQETEAQISIDDDAGVVSIFAPNLEKLEAAEARIKALTYVPEVGDIVHGQVVDIVDFGAFVRFGGGQDGLVHISELAPERVKKVTDVLQKGDDVRVKVIGFDRGKIKLSLKQAGDA